MKTLITTTLTAVLVILLISWDDNQPLVNKEVLEKKEIDFEQNKPIIKYSSERNDIIDDTGILVTNNLLSYITFDFNTNTIKFEAQGKKDSWHSWGFTFTETTKLSNAIGYKTYSTLSKMIWVYDSNIIEIELQNGQRNLFFDIKEIERKGDFSKSLNTNPKTNNPDFEYSDYWRKEAFKASKKYLTTKIPKQMPECTVTGQGIYQPNLVEYLGSQVYRVKLYCEFDCGHNYNNPSYFWVDANYVGNDSWVMTLIDQKLVD